MWGEIGKGEIFGGLSNNIEIKNYHKNDARTLFEEKKLILFSDREKKSQQFLMPIFWKKNIFPNWLFSFWRFWIIFLKVGWKSNASFHGKKTKIKTESLAGVFRFVSPK